MKSLVSLAVKGLAVVGAFQIYKEYTTPETSNRTVSGLLDNAKATVHDLTADRSIS